MLVGALNLILLFILAGSYFYFAKNGCLGETAQKVAEEIGSWFGQFWDF